MGNHAYSSVAARLESSAVLGKACSNTVLSHYRNFMQAIETVRLIGKALLSKNLGSTKDGFLRSFQKMYARTKHLRPRRTRPFRRIRWALHFAPVIGAKLTSFMDRPLVGDKSREISNATLRK